MAAPAVASTAVSPRAEPSGPLPLERLFDNRAISDDARPGRADFDGAGNSLSAQDLKAAGWTPGQDLDIDAARLRWPERRPGQPDNVRADGQQVKLHGRGNAVSFLVAASSPDVSGAEVTGTGTIRYEDGSASSYRLRAPDWRGGPLSTKAVALPHLNSAEGGQQTEKAKLYAVTVPADTRRKVRSVTLPADPGPRADLHVFAASVREDTRGWTGSWSTSTAGYPSVGAWQDQTVRLVVHTSAGGPRARIRLENTFASAPVTIGAASIAVQAEGAAARRDPVPLRFGGRSEVTIPAGAQAFSDPVGFDVPADTNLLVSLHLPGPVAAAPLHSQALQTSYLSEGGSGDRTGERDGGTFTGSLKTWPYLTGIDVQGGPGSVVALGDSITDGVKSTPGANRRWPDVLARRLREQSAGGGEVPAYGVLNHGISANRVVTDRYPGDGISTDTGGVSAQHRLERDVLAQTGAQTVVLFEGVNDVRWGATAEEVIQGMRNIAERARERGLRVVGATVTPCGGYKDCTQDVDRRRRAVNDFVRDSGGAFDAVLDFDRVLRDPERPERMLPVYDSGDHLHPGDAGLKALGESVELRALVPRR
ncbi:SGNH/GDSL hydrolase family protein [Streptomyces sp. N2-109]|uniref:SGNH/GDSL hydrolase family protein n=2 Tax=Streptomyces gossypii TaxID=2883101 RepID=A0ABT2K3G5_9ACTN|nr:SGNH/GDSL hydrolase family protein [Streptomyces gossypii]MCT2594070.1 SGNH/GDSL hydrolase family protein [Streptomyces gossypii]